MNYESKERGTCLRQIVFLVLAVLLFCQCEKLTNPDNLGDISFNNTTKNRVQITGTIHNRDVYSHTKEVSINIPCISGDKYTRKFTVPISDEGTFHFYFELAQPQDIRMDPYFDFIYLKPGDSLHIDLDFKDLDNIKLSGIHPSAVAINRQFYKYFNNTLYRENDYRIGIDYNPDRSLEEVLNKLSERRQDNHARRNLFLQKNKVRDEVKILTESMIDLDYYVTLTQIMQVRGIQNESIIDSQLLMNELNEQTTKHFNSGLYSASHFDFITLAYLPTLLKNNEFKTDEKTIDWIKRTISNDTIKNFAFATMAGSALNIGDFDFFQDLRAEIDQKYLLERLTGEYELIWCDISRLEFFSNDIWGELNDYFTFSYFGKDTNPLPKIIKQNGDKVLVLVTDIWATWYGPRSSSLEEYKKLMAQYADEEVEFIFIFINLPSEDYDRIIQLKGINKENSYLCSLEEYQSLMKIFWGLPLPYGILVNKKGVIVDYGGHVHPKLGLSAKIDHLLKHDKLTVQ